MAASYFLVMLWGNIMMDTKKADSFGLNESYVELLRAQWIENPLSVPKEWREFFEGTPKVAVVTQTKSLESTPAPKAKAMAEDQVLTGME